MALPLAITERYGNCFLTELACAWASGLSVSRCTLTEPGPRIRPGAGRECGLLDPSQRDFDRSGAPDGTTDDVTIRGSGFYCARIRAPDQVQYKIRAPRGSEDWLIGSRICHSVLGGWRWASLVRNENAPPRKLPSKHAALRCNPYPSTWEAFRLAHAAVGVVRERRGPWHGLMSRGDTFVAYLSWSHMHFPIVLRL